MDLAARQNTAEAAAYPSMNYSGLERSEPVENTIVPQLSMDDFGMVAVPSKCISPMFQLLDCEGLNP
jgi:hypothetical protein